jgi:hypothetical protein
MGSRRSGSVAGMRRLVSTLVNAFAAAVAAFGGAPHPIVGTDRVERRAARRDRRAARRSRAARRPARG